MARLAKLGHSRFFRVSIATTLIAVSVWAFTPYFSSRIASSAFVNAELVRLTSPIAGRLTTNLPHKGNFIALAENVKLVQVLSPDERQLLDLGGQYAIAKDRSELARRQLEELHSADRDLEARAEAYRLGTMQRIEREIDEANAERKGCLAEAHQRLEVGSRMEEMVTLGFSSKVRSAEALASHAATITRCEMAEARARRYRVEIESAKIGVFLRDGANDVPYSQQQRDRLLQRRQELETELLHETSKTVQLERAMQEESARLARNGEFEITLPAFHLVWSVAASPGSTVVEGQLVMDLADCRNRFVAVELPERDFERIRTGDRASIRLIGSETWNYGLVRQVRGSAARADDRLLAAQVPKPGSGSITVEIGLPDNVQPADQNDFCGIGRLAEVRFPRSFELPAMVSETLKWAISFVSPKNTVSVAAAK
jgi:multidrug resistance efflux pump